MKLVIKLALQIAVVIATQIAPQDFGRSLTQTSTSGDFEDMLLKKMSEKEEHQKLIEDRNANTTQRKN